MFGRKARQQAAGVLCDRHVSSVEWWQGEMPGRHR
jgi:hypothetical protein